MLLSSFRNYSEPVIVTIQLLRELQVNVTGSSVNEYILSHSDYPTLLCISDCLQQQKVKNAAIRIDKEKIDELPLPFILYSAGDFKVVTQITTNEIYYLDKENKTQKQNRSKLHNAWSGVALLAEAEQDAGEKDYHSKKRKENLQSIGFLALLGLGLLWILGSALIFLINQGLHSTFYYTLLLLCKLSGLVVTGLLLWYEVDKSNHLLQKICSGSSKKTNCHAILISPHAKVFSWLSWSEVGFFYFAGGFLTLCLYPQSLLYIAWLNVLALPYIIFSIGYQWLKIKQWCRLCLIVQSLLLCEFIIESVGGLLTTPNVQGADLYNLLTISIIQIILLFLLPIITWYFLKPHLLKEQEGKNKTYELARLKNNSEIFNFLLCSQNQLQSSEGLGISLGNQHAECTITEVCNPYCDPCAKANYEIGKLLEQNSNVKVNIIFTATNEEGDTTTPAVKYFMALAANGNDNITKQALDDWFLSDQKIYETLITKYPLNGEIEHQDQKIEAMDNWCKMAGVTYTPTIFINGYKLPENYSIEDLKNVL